MPRASRRLPSETEESADEEGAANSPVPQKTYALRSRKKDIPNIPLPSTDRRSRSRVPPSDGEEQVASPATKRKHVGEDEEPEVTVTPKSKRLNVATGKAGPRFSSAERKLRKKRRAAGGDVGSSGRALPTVQEQDSVSASAAPSAQQGQVSPMPQAVSNLVLLVIKY